MKWADPRRGLLFLLLYLSTCARAGTVALRDHVEVHRDTIFVADLLPANTNSSIRSTLEGIPLGRSPLPGSVRVFQADEIKARLAEPAEWSDTVLIPPQVSVWRSRETIHANAIEPAVWTFLRGLGWQDRDLPPVGTLRWTAQARTPDPALLVVAAHLDPSHRVLELHLRCVHRTQCNDFVVEAPATAMTATHFGVVSIKPSEEPPLVTRGQKAMVALEQDGMRMAVPVICLEPGRREQKIRVLNPTTHRVFLARVTNPGQLQARF